MLNSSAVWKATLGRPEEGKTSLIVCGLLITSIMAIFYVYKPTFFHFLDNRIYDTLVRSISTGALRENPVIIDIDEKTLSKFGQWPWPRYRVALLLDKLKASGASAMALDILFADIDRTSPRVLQENMLRDLKIKINFSGVPLELADNDKALANVLINGPFVLGYKFIFSPKEEQDGKCSIHPINTVFIQKGGAKEKKEFLFQPQNVICNLELFSKAASLSGFMNAYPDFDGVVRRAPLLMQYEGKFYPSLSLAAVMQDFGIKQVTVKTTSQGIESLFLNDREIPLDAKGNMLIRFRGKGKTFHYISAGDVLSGSVPDEKIKGKIIFIGTSAAGLEELSPIPLDPAFPGVEIHTNIVDNIINQTFLSRPYWASGLELFSLIIAGIIFTLVLSWTGALWSLLLMVLGAFGLWQTAHWFLHKDGIFLSPLFPLITMGCDFSILVLLKYWREEKKARARAKELLVIQDFTIRCLTSLTETRDSETGGHILRTQRYIKIFCGYLSTKPKYHDFMDVDTVEHLHKAAPLHDIGKVGVPDYVLRKTEKLSFEEFEEIKKHPAYGLEVIERAESEYAGRANTSFLRVAKEMVYTHHENWNGTGYPRGLKGEGIPLSGRIMAIIDSYDALISNRVYNKSILSHGDAVMIIARSRGLKFDPDLVDAFLEIHQKFKTVNEELGLK